MRRSSLRAPSSTKFRLELFCPSELADIAKLIQLTFVRTNDRMTQDEVIDFLTERFPNDCGPQVIARALGLSRSTVHEELKRLYAKGRIAKTRRGTYLARVEGPLPRFAGRHPSPAYYTTLGGEHPYTVPYSDWIRSLSKRPKQNK